MSDASSSSDSPEQSASRSPHYSTSQTLQDGRLSFNINISLEPGPVYRFFDGNQERQGNGNEADAQRDHAGEKPNQDGSADKSNSGDDQNPKEGTPRKPLYKRPAVVGIALLVLLILICLAIVWWRHAQTHASTDDAFIDGEVSTIAPQVSGRVVKLHVTDNQHVDAGQPLFDLDASQYQVKVDQAEAQLANAKSQLAQARSQVGMQQAKAKQATAATRQVDVALGKAKQDLERYRHVNPDAVSRQQVDAAVANVRTLRAQRDASRQNRQAAQAQVEAARAQVETAQASIKVAQANLDAARLQLSYTHVAAPIAGRVTRRTVDLGNFATAGQALLSIVSDDLWVTANYKETALSRMKRGQEVEIDIDAYPDITFHGKVDSVQSGTGSYFSMLPAENATGNYVKVVQRVPVKIVFTDDRIKDYLLAPGMSVVPDVQFPH